MAQFVCSRGVTSSRTFGTATAGCNSAHVCVCVCPRSLTGFQYCKDCNSKLHMHEVKRNLRPQTILYVQINKCSIYHMLARVCAHTHTHTHAHTHTQQPCTSTPVLFRGGSHHCASSTGSHTEATLPQACAGWSHRLHTRFLAMCVCVCVCVCKRTHAT